MCRHAGYVGPGIALSELMADMDHCLLKQSYAARELLTGVVCADGYGMAWYDTDVRPEPARYASALPIWNDPNLATMGPMIRSRMALGAVRNATVPGTTDTSNCAPFVHGRVAWSLNGFLEDFDDRWAEHVRTAWVSPERRRAVQGRTDAEWLLAATLTRWDDAPGDGLHMAMQSLLRDVMARSEETGLEAQMNLLASDGQHLIASRVGSTRSNSLYHLSDGAEFPDAHVIASEPLYDDPTWHPVPDGKLVVLQDGAPPVILNL